MLGSEEIEVKLKCEEAESDDTFLYPNKAYQTLRLNCKDGREIEINPMFLSLIFPWLRGKIEICCNDQVLLPDYTSSTIQQMINSFVRFYKRGRNVKYEVKFEDGLDIDNNDIFFQIDKTTDHNDIQEEDGFIVEDDDFVQNDSKCENIDKTLESDSIENNLLHCPNDHKEDEHLVNDDINSAHDVKTENVGMKKAKRKHKYRLCPECGKSVKNLSKHSQIHKGIRGERLQCHLCEKTLSSNNALKVHIESIHEGIKRYSCNQCSTSFVFEAYLKQHIQVVHEGYQPPAATCPDCGKKFKFISNMTRHRRITHHGENIQRRHFCQLCKQMFLKVSLLHRHMKEHHGINPRKKSAVNLGINKVAQNLQSLTAQKHNFI